MNDKDNTISTQSSVGGDIEKTNSSKSKQNIKDEGCNCWESVPRTYDKEESCSKHEKTATNNQWCSCSK